MIDEDETKETSDETDSGEAPLMPDEDPSVEALLVRIAELEDKHQRALADAENVRRRAERQQAEAIAYGIMGFARDLLPVSDNLDRALKAAAGGSSEEGAVSFIEGVDVTRRELRAVLEKNGVTKIEPQGEKFDHNFHQAMGEIEHPEAASGTVAEVIQPGYLLRDRLLRPAMVLVAKGAKNGEAEGR